MNWIRQQNKTFFFPLFYAVFLGGLSLASALALLATSAWLISSASTISPLSLLHVAITSIICLGFARGFFKYGERLLIQDSILQIQSKLYILIYRALAAKSIQYLPLNLSLSQGEVFNKILQDVKSIQDKWVRLWVPWSGALISGIIGSGIIFWLDLRAGVVTLTLTLVTLALIPRVSTTSSKLNLSKIAESESYFSEQISSSITGHLEAQIFNFADKYRDSLNKSELELASKEKSSFKISGVAICLVYIAMSINIIANAIIAINAFQAGTLAGVNIAVLTLAPLAIYDSIAALPSAFSDKSKMDRSEEFINETLNDELSQRSIDPGRNSSYL
jgi:ABC-type transport system involved in cytochrome bd biosynthesis fused ATPase/permease subunit